MKNTLFALILLLFSSFANAGLIFDITDNAYTLTGGANVHEQAEREFSSSEGWRVADWTDFLDFRENNDDQAWTDLMNTLFAYPTKTTGQITYYGAERYQDDYLHFDGRVLDRDYYAQFRPSGGDVLLDEYIALDHPQTRFLQLAAWGTNDLATPVEKIIVVREIPEPATALLALPALFLLGRRYGSRNK